MRISDWSSDVCSADLTSRRNVCSGRCCTSWVKTKRPCDMTASRSGLGPASGGDALESVTGNDRSNNDVKQPLTRLDVNFYRTVVTQAKKGGSSLHGAKTLDVDVAVVKDGEVKMQLA